MIPTRVGSLVIVDERCGTIRIAEVISITIDRDGSRCRLLLWKGPKLGFTTPRTIDTRNIVRYAKWADLCERGFGRSFNG